MRLLRTNLIARSTILMATCFRRQRLSVLARCKIQGQTVWELFELPLWPFCSQLFTFFSPNSIRGWCCFSAELVHIQGNCVVNNGQLVQSTLRNTLKMRKFLFALCFHKLFYSLVKISKFDGQKRDSFNKIGKSGEKLWLKYRNMRLKVFSNAGYETLPSVFK